MTSTFLIINDELCLVKHNKFSIETSNFLTLIKINMKDKNFKTKNFIHCRLINEMIYLSKLFVLDQRSRNINQILRLNANKVLRKSNNLQCY